MFRNSIKLLMSNFSTFWKLFVYKFIVIAITVGLFCASLSHLQQIPTFQPLLDTITSLFISSNVATGFNAISTSFYDIFVALGNFFVDLIAVFPAVFVYLCFVFAVILPFLWHLSDFAISEGLFSFMSSQSKTGFTSSLIQHLKTSSKYSITFTIIILFANAIFISGVFGLLSLTTISPIFSSLATFFVLILCTIYLSLRITVLSTWSGAIVTADTGVLRGLALGIKMSNRKFFHILSNAIFFVFAFIVLTIITSFFGLIILLPLLCLFISVFGIVNFFESCGMRYYVDYNSIVSPKKYEQTDKIKKLKNII